MTEYLTQRHEGHNGHCFLFLSQRVRFSSRHEKTSLTSGLNEGDEIVTRNQILVYSELKGI